MKELKKTMQKVPTDSRTRKFEVLSGKANIDMVEKKKALSPNADRGKAVAVPRWFGQFRTAVGLYQG